MKKTSLKSLVAQRDALNRQIRQLMAERLSPGTIVHVKDGSLCQQGRKDPTAITRIPDWHIIGRGEPIPFRITRRRGRVVYLEDIGGWNDHDATYHVKVEDITKVVS